MSRLVGTMGKRNRNKKLSKEEGKLEVIVILGKELHNDALTPEGKSRILHAVYVIRRVRVRAPDYVAFTGGGTRGHTEGGLMKDHFQRLLPKFPTSKIIEEREAENTVENVELILNSLTKRGIDLSRVKLTIVSTDYHLLRMQAINELNLVSPVLLSAIKNAGATHECCPAPYIFRELNPHIPSGNAEPPISEVGWMAALYELSDSFRIFDSYLADIVKNNGNVDLRERKDLSSKVLSGFKEDLRNFNNILIERRPPTISQERERIITDGFSSSQKLENYYEEFRDFFSKPSKNGNFPIKTSEMLHSTIGGIYQLTDPDKMTDSDRAKCKMTEISAK